MAVLEIYLLLVGPIPQTGGSRVKGFCIPQAAQRAMSAACGAPQSSVKTVKILQRGLSGKQDCVGFCAAVGKCHSPGS